MKRYVALLRGINVGGKNKIAMAELKIGFSKLGLQKVATYLNSGNVIFSGIIDDEMRLFNNIRLMIKDTFWWSKTASSNVGNKITIRTANTVRKIADM